MPVPLDALAERLRLAFERIQATRMQGLPILNPKLQVQVVGGRRHAGDWIGVLVSPWCMNLVLIPGPDSDSPPGPLGSGRTIAFPAGSFEFLASEESDIGPFSACSLFSPMGDFPDQATAVATAETILEALFSSAAEAAPATDPGAASRPGISRRDWLRGRFRPG